MRLAFVLSQRSQAVLKAAAAVTLFNAMQGVQCPYAHGVYERNLHPSKYRTQLCTEGNHCSRHVCFFAHSPFQLRAPTHLWSIEEAVSPLLPAQLSCIHSFEHPSVISPFKRGSLMYSLITKVSLAWPGCYCSRDAAALG